MVTIDNMETVLTLKQRFCENNPDVGIEKLKLLYGGKILDNSKTIASYYIRSEVVIQVFVSG